jgi:hypothetical protein
MPHINALGKTASEAVHANLTEVLQHDVCRKRSFDSVEQRHTRRAKHEALACSSPPLSPEEPLRLVSPDFPSMTAKAPCYFSADPPQLFSQPW